MVKNILHKWSNDVNQYRSKVGMVFQSFNLFNNLSVIENCMIRTDQSLKAFKRRSARKSRKIFKRSWYV